MVSFDRILIIFFVAIVGKFSLGSLYTDKNDTNFENPANFDNNSKPASFETDSNNSTAQNTTLDHEVQSQGIITPIDFYDRIMQHLEERQLSPRDLIGPTEVFLRAMMMFDKLYEAYIEEVSPSNASLMVIINPEEILTCENFYTNLTSFVKTEYQVADQNEPMQLVIKAREMYD